MTCRECLEKFSSLSADEIPDSSAHSIREHLAACPECLREWHVFEHTLFILSSSTQPLPTPDTSEVMWRHCSEHIFHKVEAARQNPNRLKSGAARAGFWGWVTRQPGWSWATLGGAAAILGTAWWLAPQDEPVIPQDNSGAPATLVTFQRPSEAASGLVNHHSAMAADPFTDSVGSTLVSYSASAPSTGTPLAATGTHR